MSSTKMRFIDGVEPPEQPVRFTFEGEPVSGCVGESIASAMMRAGVLTFRRTRVGEQARGYYCGMGLCWECAVHVEGDGVVKGCAHPVGEGLVVTQADGGGAAE